MRRLKRKIKRRKINPNFDLEQRKRATDLILLQEGFQELFDRAVELMGPIDWGNARHERALYGYWGDLLRTEGGLTPEKRVILKGTEADGQYVRGEIDQDTWYRRDQLGII